jgi:hypothetical protein
VGEEHIYQVDKDLILGKLQGGLWKGTFNKLWLFNLTEFTKLIVLDGDIMIRTNIMHWLDYPTPCAIQANDNIEWNSGAMVIAPDTVVFNEMLELLPNVTAFDGKSTSPGEDNMNSAFHDQGFLSAFFTRQAHGSANWARRMKTMPTEAAILSSSFVRPQFRYFVENRLHIFDTIHFTVDKPYRPATAPSHPVLCEMLRDWFVSIEGLERYNLTPPSINCFRNCPNVSFPDKSL